MDQKLKTRKEATRAQKASLSSKLWLEVTSDKCRTYQERNCPCRTLVLCSLVYVLRTPRKSGQEEWKEVKKQKEMMMPAEEVRPFFIEWFGLEEDLKDLKILI